MSSSCVVVVYFIVDEVLDSSLKEAIKKSARNQSFVISARHSQVRGWSDFDFKKGRHKFGSAVEKKRIARPPIQITGSFR